MRKPTSLLTLLLGLICLCWLPPRTSDANTETPIPRIVLALYDSQEEADISLTRIHRLAELPLNHLGLVVQYHDIRKALPSLPDPDQLRGVITWFTSDAIPEPALYLSWAKELMDIGKRFVVLGSVGVDSDIQEHSVTITQINEFLRYLGVSSTDNWIEVTYDLSVLNKDPYMVEFERKLGDEFPPFLWVNAISGLGHSFLTLRRENDPKTVTDLVVIGPSGGYAALGYTHFIGTDPSHFSWYLNPFEFFRQAFKTDELPKPDTTTLSGRRIYYSHVDGDGWRNISMVPKYLKKRATSTEVILEEIVKPNPDLPVTIAPIASDFNPKWFDDNNLLTTVRTILAFPQVEAGSHSYPRYVQNAQQTTQTTTGKTQQESALTDIQGGASAKPAFSTDNRDIDNGESERTSEEDKPRSNIKEALRYEREISGSIALINHLLPENKRVKVYQWSTGLDPKEEEIAATKGAKLGNINGGQSRYDRAYPSHAWLTPLARQVGRHWQIYASDSSETAYTDNWTQRYFGFQHLVQTLLNTETPVRLKPINLHYHIYSGEKTSSLAALKSNLDFIRRQQIIPITTSHYTAIVDGFFATEITALDKNRWRIENRETLQTIRFDNATQKTLDFTLSEGVTGQRHYQGSLYVSLDETHPAPVITLTDSEKTDQEPFASRPFLVQSQWQVFNFESTKNSVHFSCSGFGTGEFLWKFPRQGSYQVEITNNADNRQRMALNSDEKGMLALKIDGEMQQQILTVQISLLEQNKNQDPSLSAQHPD